MWFWLIGGVGALFLYSKSKQNAAANKAAGNGIATNPITNFWNAISAQGTKLQNDLSSNLTTQAGSILGGVSTNGGSKGANSPQTTGSGTAAPLPSGSGDSDDSDSSYGGSGMSYGDDDDGSGDYGD